MRQHTLACVSTEVLQARKYRVAARSRALSLSLARSLARARFLSLSLPPPPTFSPPSLPLSLSISLPLSRHRVSNRLKTRGHEVKEVVDDFFFFKPFVWRSLLDRPAALLAAASYAVVLADAKLGKPAQHAVRPILLFPILLLPASLGILD